MAWFECGEILGPKMWSAFLDFFFNSRIYFSLEQQINKQTNTIINETV